MKKSLMITLCVCIPCSVVCLVAIVLGSVYLSSREAAGRKDGGKAALETYFSPMTTETSDATAMQTAETEALTESEVPAETEVPTETAPPAETGPVDYSNAGGGTSSANVFNGGFIATDGEREYFRGSDGGMYYNEIGSSEAYKLLDNAFLYLNVQGGWLYFADQTNQCMAKMRTDGTDYQILYPANVHEVNVSGSYIYFCSDTQLMRMRTDGMELETLCDGKIWFLNVVGQELYFCRIGDERAMCRCSVDGSDFETIIAAEVYDILVYGGYIYYCFGRDERYLYARSRDTGEVTQITNNYTRWINTDGIHVYYTNFEGHTEEGVGYGNTMYRVDLHGGGNEQLFTDIVEGMCIQNGKLHYMNPDLEKKYVELY